MEKNAGKIMRIRKETPCGTVNANVGTRNVLRDERKNEMKEHDDIMTAEEFLGIPVNPSEKKTRKGRPRGKKKRDALFAEVKVKMVMRIYGVTKARALEILSGRAGEKKPAEVSAGNVDEIEDDEEDVPFMSAAEFFGACK